MTTIRRRLEGVERAAKNRLGDAETEADRRGQTRRAFSCADAEMKAHLLSLSDAELLALEAELVASTKDSDKPLPPGFLRVAKELALIGEW